MPKRVKTEQEDFQEYARRMLNCYTSGSVNPLFFIGSHPNSPNGVAKRKMALEKCSTCPSLVRCRDRTLRMGVDGSVISGGIDPISGYQVEIRERLAS